MVELIPLGRNLVTKEYLKIFAYDIVHADLKNLIVKLSGPGDFSLGIDSKSFVIIHYINTFLRNKYYSVHI